MTQVLLVAIVFLAAFVQALSGFGFGLIIMPLVTLVVGLETAAPLVALTGLTVCTTNLIRHRRAINAGEVIRLSAASALGVPVGIWMLANVNELLVRQVLGLLLISYAAYTLACPTAPRLPSRRWVYPAGFVAGCLGGAYNAPGPPAIVYGSLQQWPKDEFRAVMQAFFALNAALVVVLHLFTQRMTAEVLTFFLYALPALLVGTVVASRLDGKLDRKRFRTIVIVMILILGLLLVLGLG